MASRDYTTPNSKTVVIPNEYSDIDIMFTAHPISGDVTTKKDSDAVRRSVRNILLTNNYERPFKPNFGSNLTNRLFELRGIGAKKRIRNDIVEALTTLEPRISDIRIDFSESDTNNLDVKVEYVIKNGLRRDSIDFTVSRVR